MVPVDGLGEDQEQALFHPSDVELGETVRDIMARVAPAFVTQTGLTAAVGRRVTEPAPGHEQRWYDLRCDIALTGDPARIENNARATKGVGKGTGLGPSMAHRLASQPGGALTIDSAPGVGTDIALWLPQSTEPAVAVVRVATPTAPTGSGVMVLVDDVELRVSTADMLSDMGFTVVEAGPGEEALRLIEAGLNPNLPVTDHLMPGMAGAELARTIRRHSPASRILLAPSLPKTTASIPTCPG